MASPQLRIVVKAAVVFGAIGLIGWEIHALVPEVRGSLKQFGWWIRGEAAIPAIAHSLDRSNELALQVAAVETLRNRGAASVPGLLELLGSDDSRDQYAAILALRAIGRDARDACPILAERIKSETDAERRLILVGVLRTAGIDSPEGISGLIYATKDADQAVQIDALLGLAHVDASNGEAVDALVGALKDRDGLVRREAAESIGTVRPKRKDIVPALIVALRDSFALVRSEAAEALGALAPDTGQAIPALIESLRDPEMRVRNDASRTLALIGKAAVEPLIAQLDSKDLNVMTIRTLGRMGPAASPAASRLERLTKEGPKDLRADVEQALARIRAKS